MKTSAREWLRLLGRAALRWDRHSAPSVSAAMAFYVLVSIAPLSVIAVGLAGRALGETEVRQHVAESAERLLDPAAAALVSEILETRWVRRSEPVGNLVALLILVFASTAGFNHLRASLNRMFESPPQQRGTVVSMLRGRALAFGAVLIVGVTVLASLIMRTALVAIDTAVDLLGTSILLPLSVFAVAEGLVMVAMLTVLFAVVFRILPDRKLQRHPLLVGACVSAVLFILGEWVIGQYMGHVAVASAFGVAGSSVVLAAWVYYSSMVFLYGAALTCVYAERRPSAT